MSLTLASIRRPVLISMLVLALVILGLRSREAMPKESIPDINLPYVAVFVTYPGAGPQEVETLVTQVIEDAVAGVNNVRHITSQSRENLALIGIEFEMGTDLDATAADVRDKVSSIRGALPDDVGEPSITRININSMPILTMAMTGKMPSRELRNLGDTTVKDAFSKVGGVSAVSVEGGDQREIQVVVDKARLQAYGMSMGQLVSAINQRNLNIPGGTIKETGREYAVRMVGEFRDVDQIRDVRILVPAKAPYAKPYSIRLGDVAQVNDTVQEADRITRLGIKDNVPTDAIVIAVQKQSGSNTLETANGVKKEIARLTGQIFDEKTGELRDHDPTIDKGPAPQGILPADVGLVLTTDASTYVRDSLNDVNRTLVEGIILVVLIIFVFLHSARATLIVALSIPTSMFITYLPLHAMGLTVNFMTLLGLSLAIGILVDDSIVVLENIERHLGLGEEPKEAALNGRMEIGLAAITITLVDVVVFLPIANMGGIVGEIFRPFGWAVAISTLLSLFMSFTLTPMLASRFFEKGHGSEEQKRERRGFFAWLFNSFDRNYDRLANGYRNVLQWTLHNRSLTIWTGWATLFTVVGMASANKLPFLIIILVVMGMGLLFSRDRVPGLYITATLVALTLLVRFNLPVEFMPNTDRGEFSVTVEGESGQSMAVTDRSVMGVAKVISGLKDPESGIPLVEYVTTTTGATSTGARMGMGSAGSQYGSVSVKLVKKHERSVSVRDVMRIVTERTASIPNAKIETAQESLGMGGKPIEMEVTGSDMDQNLRIAKELQARMDKVPGVIESGLSWKEGKPELQINIDEQKAADKGMTAAQVGSIVRSALQGTGDSAGDTKFRVGGDQYNIRVQYDKPDRTDAGAMERLTIGAMNGKPVMLRDIATVEIKNAPTEIRRKDRQRLVTVDANVAQGYAQGDVQSEVSKVAREMNTGSSRIAVGGTGNMQAESFGHIFSALILAVLLVYMLMAALFESLTTPFVIWLSIPQALIGALLGLMMTNRTFSIVSMVGMIMLVGLVAKNAILMLDYTNTLRSRGKKREEAVLEAGPTRLRPVLMTTFAMVFAMIPTAIALNEGSEMRQPMAIAVIFGLILSTFLTLLVVPVTYTLMDDIVVGSRNRIRRLLGRKPVTDRHSAAETASIGDR